MRTEITKIEGEVILIDRWSAAHKGKARIVVEVSWPDHAQFDKGQRVQIAVEDERPLLVANRPTSIDLAGSTLVMESPELVLESLRLPDKADVIESSARLLANVMGVADSLYLPDNASVTESGEPPPPPIKFREFT